MAEAALIFAIVSPVPVAIGLVTYFFIQRSQAVEAKTSWWGFIGTVVFWGVVAGVVAAIVIFVISAYYDSGNGPLAIFLYGPPAFALGSIVGAIIWRRDTVKPNHAVERDARKSGARPSP